MLSRLRDRFDAWDVQVSVGLNPLNWQVKSERYAWAWIADAGPIHVAVFHG